MSEPVISPPALQLREELYIDYFSSRHKDSFSAFSATVLAREELSCCSNQGRIIMPRTRTAMIDRPIGSLHQRSPILVIGKSPTGWRLRRIALHKHILFVSLGPKWGINIFRLLCIVADDLVLQDVSSLRYDYNSGTTTQAPI